MRAAIERISAFLATVPRREKAIVAAAMAVCTALVLVYMAISPSHQLAGDEPTYDEYAREFAAGHPWEQSLPSPIPDPHPSAWKAPVYPAWVGLWYTVLGTSDWPGSMQPWERVEVIQALFLAPLTILLIWLLARRLFGPRPAMAAALLGAAFPLVWEPFGLLFPEALAIPLFLGFMLIVLDRTPTVRRSIGAGALLGLCVLVHPASFVLAGTLVVAWWIAAGWRRGLALSALAGGVAVLVILPWTVRNLVVFNGDFIPVSIQDAAIYGTFNSQSANDPTYPYAWRATPEPDLATLEQMSQRSVGEAEFHDTLRDLGLDYIQDHPASVPAAMFYNGFLRFWDLRPPGQAIDEAKQAGRSTKVRALGLVIYYALLVLAVVGMWRLRRRREIVLPALAAFALVAVIFMIIGATRYRAPFEPLLVILACSLLAGPECLARRERPTADPHQGDSPAPLPAS